LVAQDIEGYVDIAVRLAHDQSQLTNLRATLRARMAASPLCDAGSFAQRVEGAYRSMWRIWCRDSG
jgi:predicted O-linked N-acetylglucosamine transferase (SPINDLY family)